MNTEKKEEYRAPLTEIVELESEGIMAASLFIDDEEVENQRAGSKRRSFWDE